MIFYFLITIVFIAEIIITAAILIHLAKWSKTFEDLNGFLDEAKPKLKYISKIGLKISEQLTELAPIWVDNLKTAFWKQILNTLKGVLAGSLLWKLKKRFKISKIRGLGLLKIIRMFS